MINATELNNRMPTRPAYEIGSQTMTDILDVVLPHIEKGIMEMASYGGHGTLIKREEIMKLISFTWLSRKEIMDGIAKAVGEAGYKISIPMSYTSIHIEW